MELDRVYQDLNEIEKDLLQARYFGSGLPEEIE
jgi:hypothetical protein